MKMSEIFDLPVTSDDLYEIFVHYGTTEDQDEAVANVINHADALADALELIIFLVDVTNEDESRDLDLAKAALAAYRGAK